METRSAEPRPATTKSPRRTGAIWMVTAALGFAILSVLLAVRQVQSLNRRLVEQTTLAARSIAATASELVLQKLDTSLGRIAYGAAIMGRQFQLDAPTPAWLNGIYLWTGDALVALKVPSEDARQLEALVSDQVTQWIDQAPGDRGDRRTRVLHVANNSTGLTIGLLPIHAGVGEQAAVVVSIDVEQLIQETVVPMLSVHGGLELSRIGVDAGDWDQPMSGVLSAWAVKPADAHLRHQRGVIFWRTAAYLGLTALALATLLASMWLLLRVVRRETTLARMKANFVADVSHELKTPLATIRLYCETLESGRITSDEKRQEYYRTITRESTRLSDMINTILDFSRIDGGHEEFELQTLDVGDVVHETYDAYRLKLDRENFEHKLSIEPDLPAVSANRDRISQVIWNLITNAVKYSDEDRFLEIEVAKDTRRGRRGVLISVHDRGIGIRPEERAHLSEGFFRSNESRVRQRGGTGLGLALVKQIVDAHQGSFHVESRLVKGSTFRIFLPEAEHDASSERCPTSESDAIEQKSDADGSGEGPGTGG